MTLQETADRAGIDVGHLSRVERGMSGLSINSLRRLAEVLPLGDLDRRLALFDLSPETRESSLDRTQDSRDDDRVQAYP